ncbi:MAG: glycosyltransferase [Gammaproteobacteria bacterium]
MSAPAFPAAVEPARIAVVVLNYRNAAHTMACLRSIPAADVAQVLVWDNSVGGGSSTAELAAPIAALRPDSPPIELVVSPVNLGFAAGVNAAIRHLRAGDNYSHYLLLNNDAVLPANAIPSLLRTLSSAPGVVAAAPLLLTHGRTAGLRYHHRWLALQVSRPWQGTFAYASGCCLLIDAARMPDPLFDPAFFMYGEDVALAWKLRGMGLDIAIDDGVVIDHAGSGSSVLGSPFYEYHMARSHSLLTRQLATGSLAAKLMIPALRFCALLLRACARAVRGRSMLPVSQTLLALRGWRDIQPPAPRNESHD